MPLLNEQPEGVGVFVDVPAGKALIGHIEERVEFPLLDHCAHFFPLLWLLGKREYVISG